MFSSTTEFLKQVGRDPGVQPDERKHLVKREREEHEDTQGWFSMICFLLFVIAFFSEGSAVPVKREPDAANEAGGEVEEGEVRNLAARLGFFLLIVC